jgi:hypothetical protein
MSRKLQWLRGALLLVLGAASGCVGHGFSASYGVGFYRPFGYSYGSWGPGYWVGPPRRASAGPARWAARPGGPARPLPSIPGRSRAGRRGSMGPGRRPVPPR